MVDIKEILTLMAQVQQSIVHNEKWILKNIEFNQVGAPPTFVWQNVNEPNSKLLIRPEIGDNCYDIVIVEKSFQGETILAKYNAQSRIRKPIAVINIAYNFVEELIVEDGNANAKPEDASSMDFKVEK